MRSALRLLLSFALAGVVAPDARPVPRRCSASFGVLLKATTASVGGQLASLGERAFQALLQVLEFSQAEYNVERTSGERLALATAAMRDAGGS